MFEPFDLTGKVALVTGGSGGIGLGMADALARAGASLVLWDLNAARLLDARQQLAVHGATVTTQSVDVRDEAAVEDAMTAALRAHGRIDCAIACAGVLAQETPFVASTLESWRAVQAVNVEGAYLTFRAAARHMVDRAQTGDPGGSLVGIASTAAMEGVPKQEAYCASKGAMISLVQSLAVEHARFAIRANAIAPGMIATQMTAPMQQSAAVEKKLVPRIPMRRWGTPADFGGIAVYLASGASAYHTGDVFVIDGGYVVG